MRIFIKRYGYDISCITMHKYMNKELNLCAVIMHSKPGYKAGIKNKIFDNLLNQNFTVGCKNKIWCTDFTYMRQPNGKFRYNCSIIDLYDRSAVASLNSDYINTALAINTLKMALKKENYPKVILHSDQGVQFTSWEFVKFCKENNVIQSMSRSGCPYDNAPMERFYNTFKSNFYNVTAFSSVEMMDELTMKYINWYNYVRPHSYNDYLTPMEARYIQVFIEQSVTKMLDQYNLDDKLTKEAQDDKYSELSKKLDKCEEEKAIFADCALSQKSIADKMKAIRAKLKKADILDQFDRVVFESLVEKVIVGEQADDGTVDPYKLTFVLKGMDERSIPDARDRYMNLHKAE